MSEHKFRVCALRKSYNSGVSRLEVLKGIELAIKKGEFLAIQGPSGAGKSTLLHILGGLDEPSSGEVFFEGASLAALSEEGKANFRNRRVGFVFQFYHLLPELSVLENVILPGLLNSWSRKKETLAFARQLLDDLGLSSRLTHRPRQLSGGEQQRAAIARALINKPEALLCDEPTGNLDSENGAKIIALLDKLHRQEKMTIILITHDKDIAKSAERVVQLKDGIVLN